jgi:C_GCAxxG_C_C family probable redox protein
MDKTEIGNKSFTGGFNCSQSVLTAFSDSYGLDRKTALRLSCGFGAGFGREQEICGAVSGAVMVIGLKYGQQEAEDSDSKEKTYSAVSEFLKSFKGIHRSLKCSELTGCDLKTESGKNSFRDDKLKEKVCAKCISDAIGILETMLD